MGIENLPPLDEGDTAALGSTVWEPLIYCRNSVYFKRRMRAIIHVPAAYANYLRLSNYKGISKVPIHSWYSIWFPILKYRPSSKNQGKTLFWSRSWFHPKANFFEVKWNSRLILFHRHQRQPQIRGVPVSVLFGPSPGSCFFPGCQTALITNATTQVNWRPIEWQTLPNLLTSLAASFYKLKASQNNFDCFYHGKREATWIVFVLFCFTFRSK